MSTSNINAKEFILTYSFNIHLLTLCKALNEQEKQENHDPSKRLKVGRVNLDNNPIK